jgi:ferredoxin-type protein NapG
MKGTEAISRADFFKKGFKLLAREIGRAVSQDVKEKAKTFTAPLIRPPGAVDEVSFLLKCTRCDLCSKACPHDAVKQAGAEKGSAMGTPVIIPEEQPCRMCEEFPCIAACPQEALVQAPFYKIGTARITPVKCFAFNGQVCDYCHDCCPEKDKAIVMEKGKPIVFEDKCTGCGICEFYCPAPGKAIRILPEVGGKPGRKVG